MRDYLFKCKILSPNAFLNHSYTRVATTVEWWVYYDGIITITNKFGEKIFLKTQSISQTKTVKLVSLKGSF